MSLFNHQYHCTSLHCSLQCRFTSTETISTVRDGEPRMDTSTFTHLLSSKTMNLVQCCFTSSEIIVKDGETMTATLTSSPLLRSETMNLGSVLLYVHSDYYGRGAQDGHLDFHTAPQL